jgi:hypothetical protein
VGRAPSVVLVVLLASTGAEEPKHGGLDQAHVG